MTIQALHQRAIFNSEKNESQDKGEIETKIRIEVALILSLIKTQEITYLKLTKSVCILNVRVETIRVRIRDVIEVKKYCFL